MAKRITIADIAKKTDLSPTTVSFVLNNRQDKGISDETRQKVLETALEMGYKRMGRLLANEWRRVAYLTEDIAYFNSNTSFFAGVYSNMQQKAVERKTELFLFELKLSKSPENAYSRLREFHSLGIELFIANSGRHAKFLCEHDQKCVLIQGGGVIEECVCVYCDDYKAGQLAAAHALEMGHKTAGLIFGNSSSPRFSGFIDYFTSHGGECPERFRWFLPTSPIEMEKAVAELSKDTSLLPSLFYCFADNLVFNVMRGFHANGLRVPDDISLIGTDNLYWGRVCLPAFTTVDLCEDLFADKVFEAIEHVANGGAPYQLAVPVRLLPRETVKDLTKRR